MNRSKLVFGAIAAVVAVGVTGASAQNVGPDFLKQRQDYMSSMFRGGIATFRKYASGEETNAAAVAESATRLAALAGDMNKWFPPGTDRDALAGSRTKPDVWTKKAEFDAASVKLVDESRKLASIAAGGNADAIKAQITVTTNACLGCHGGPVVSGGTFRFEKPQ